MTNCVETRCVETRCVQTRCVETRCAEIRLRTFRPDRAGTLAQLFAIELVEELLHQFGQSFWILFLLDLLRHLPPVFPRGRDLIWSLNLAGLPEFFSNLLNSLDRNLLETCFRRSHLITPSRSSSKRSSPEAVRVISFGQSLRSL